MKIILKIIKYELSDLLRSKWLVAYILFFFLLTDILFRTSGNGAKVVISLLNVILIFSPLIVLIFIMIYLYNAREFMELLLTQPVSRSQLFVGMYSGLAFPLILSVFIGITIPILYNWILIENSTSFVLLVLTAIIITLIFTALAFYLTFQFEDKIKGLGLAVGVWLFMTIIYDGVIMILLFMFADYPLENFSIVISLLNPVDLGRIFLLLNLDISALMGYTGASFARFFGSTGGMFTSFFTMLFWITVPFFMGLHKFVKKDF